MHGLFSSKPGNAPRMLVPRLIVISLIMRVFVSLVAESEPATNCVIYVLGCSLDFAGMPHLSLLSVYIGSMVCI